MQSHPEAPAPEELHLDSLMQAIGNSVLTNRGTGMGTARDPYTQVAVDHGPLLTERELRALYRGSWFIRRVVELLPQDMLRREPQITMHGDPDDDLVGKVLQAYRDGGVGLNPYSRRMSCAESFRRAMIWARLFGMGYCVLRVNGGENPAKPLKSVRSFEGLSVLDRYALRPDFNSPNPDFPEFYQVARGENPRSWEGDISLGDRIHESRVLVFTGAMIHPYDIQIEGSGGHDSVVQPIYEAFVRHYMAKGAISKGLDSYSLFKVAIAGLSTLMQAPGGRDTLTQYLNTVAQQMSLHNILVQDTEASKAEFQERSFAGVAENFKFFIDDMVASTGYPHYKIFGSVDKAGLADSGGAETRAWAESVHGNQMMHLGDNHRRLFHAIFESLGTVPDSWEVEYPSIYVPTPDEEAELAKKQADTYSTLTREGIITTTQAYQAIATGQPLESVCEPLDADDVLTIVDEAEAEGPSAEEELALLLGGDAGGAAVGGDTPSSDEPATAEAELAALMEGGEDAPVEAEMPPVVESEPESPPAVVDDPDDDSDRTDAAPYIPAPWQVDSLTAEEQIAMLLGWRGDKGKGGKGKGKSKQRQKPNCTKGRSCGMSCVAKDKRCKADLGPAAKVVADNVAARDPFDPASNPMPPGGAQGGQGEGGQQQQVQVPVAPPPQQLQPQPAAPPQQQIAPKVAPSLNANPGWNPFAKPDMTPEQFREYVAAKHLLKDQANGDSVHNQSWAQYKAANPLSSKGSYSWEVKAAIDDGFVPSAAAIADAKVPARLRPQIDANQQRQEVARLQIEDMERAINAPVVANADGWAPTMDRSAAASYLRDSFFGTTEFYSGNRAKITDDIANDGAKPWLNSRGMYGQGLYFGIDQRIAEGYAMAASGNGTIDVGMVTSHIRAQNPYITNRAEFASMAASFPGSQDSGIDSSAVTAFLKARGFDSVYLQDVGYGVAFDQKQVVTVNNERLTPQRIQEIEERETGILRQQGQLPMAQRKTSDVVYVEDNAAAQQLSTLRRSPVFDDFDFDVDLWRPLEDL